MELPQTLIHEIKVCDDLVFKARHVPTSVFAEFNLMMQRTTPGALQTQPIVDAKPPEVQVYEAEQSYERAVAMENFMKAVVIEPRIVADSEAGEPGTIAESIALPYALVFCMRYIEAYTQWLDTLMPFPGGSCGATGSDMSTLPQSTT